jgi:hypothetical protein
MGLSMNNNGLDSFKKTASLLARNTTALFVLGSVSLLSACGGGGAVVVRHQVQLYPPHQHHRYKPRHQFLHLHLHLHQHQAPL